MTTVAMRLVLDRAATVEEALNLYAAHNIYSSLPSANFHFFLADASGSYCILEYAPGDNGAKATGSFAVDEITDEAFRAGCDGSDEGAHRMVTNLYTLFKADEYGYDDGEHGLDRYEILQNALAEADYTLSETGAMALLSEVYQDYGATPTHETQWSVVYNPVALSADVCPRADQNDNKEAFYHTVYSFRLKDTFEGGAITCDVRPPIETGDTPAPAEEPAAEPETAASGALWPYAVGGIALLSALAFALGRKKKD